MFKRLHTAGSKHLSNNFGRSSVELMIYTIESQVKNVEITNGMTNLYIPYHYK